MSKIKSEEKYKKSPAYSFFSWLHGTKDLYVGNVEIDPAKVKKINCQSLAETNISKETNIEESKPLLDSKLVKRGYVIFSIVFCLVLVTLLLAVVSNLEPTGEYHKYVNNEVSQKYIEDGLDDTGAVNIVAGMILDYRAFDTLGESHVLFVATMCVFVMLRNDKRKADEDDEDPYEPEGDSILKIGSKILIPVIFLFGIYVILNGHLGPGGGFAGGAIMGSALILYVNAYGFKKASRFFNYSTYKWICFCSLSFYCLAKSYSFFTGANHLHSIIPKGIPGAILSGGLILPLNIAVGLVVCCTMYGFYAMFKKGGF